MFLTFKVRENPLCLVHNFVCSSKNISGRWAPCHQSPRHLLPTDSGVQGSPEALCKVYCWGQLGQRVLGGGLCCFFPRCWSSWLRSTGMASLEAPSYGEPGS